MSSNCSCCCSILFSASIFLTTKQIRRWEHAKNKFSCLIIDIIVNYVKLTSSSNRGPSFLQPQMSSDNLQDVHADLVMGSQRGHFECDYISLVVQRSQVTVHSHVGMSTGHVARVILKSKRPLDCPLLKNRNRISRVVSLQDNIRNFWNGLSYARHK